MGKRQMQGHEVSHLNRMAYRGITAKHFRIALLLPAIILLCVCPAKAFAVESMRTITDRMGRIVKIPVNPQRIACFLGPSYEKVLLLGAADRVVMTAIDQPPWSYKIRPAVKKNSLMDLQVSYSDPDVERLLEAGIDLVFYWPWPRQTEKMSAAGVSVICPVTGKRLPATMEEYVRGIKDEIMFYGEVLGEKAKKTAAAYCNYYDRKMRQVLVKTSKIPSKQRPKVHFVTGRSIFGTQGRHSVAYWVVEGAGGTLASKDAEEYQVEASMEQIIAWNPDVVVIGGLTQSNQVIEDHRWKGISAVKKNRVYPAPEGVFMWSHGSSESFLLVMWLAKMLHPDKFGDLDMVKEVRDYYHRFYHYPLTAEEARLILSHLPPK
jgi:iron complex transport system substrate-binding protein